MPTSSISSGWLHRMETLKYALGVYIYVIIIIRQSTIYSYAQALTLILIARA